LALYDVKEKKKVSLWDLIAVAITAGFRGLLMCCVFHKVNKERLLEH
jgi:hypothetical protein